MKNKHIEEAKEIIKEKIIDQDYYDPEYYNKNIKNLKFYTFKTFIKNQKKKLELSRQTMTGEVNNETLNEMEEDQQDISSVTLAFYSPKENNIVYRSKLIDTEVILHEMIHMSTTRRPGQIGFTKKVGKTDYCDRNMINEGTTQWLAHKTLHGNDIENSIYPWQTRIARLLTIAIGEEEYFKYFSKADFKGLNRKIQIKHDQFPLRKLATLMETFEQLYEYLYLILSDESIPYNPVFKESVRILRRMKYILKKMQYIIIEIFLQNPDNVANIDKINEFYSALITHDLDNQFICELFEPIIENNYTAHIYFENVLKRNYRDLYKSLKKVQQQ